MKCSNCSKEIANDIRSREFCSTNVETVTNNYRSKLKMWLWLVLLVIAPLKVIAQLDIPDNYTSEESISYNEPFSADSVVQNDSSWLFWAMLILILLVIIISALAHKKTPPKTISNCPKCGRKIAEDSVFCEYCGAKIA